MHVWGYIFEEIKMLNDNPFCTHESICLSHSIQSSSCRSPHETLVFLTATTEKLCLPDGSHFFLLFSWLRKRGRKKELRSSHYQRCDRRLCNLLGRDESPSIISKLRDKISLLFPLCCSAVWFSSPWSTKTFSFNWNSSVPPLIKIMELRSGMARRMLFIRNRLRK